MKRGAVVCIVWSVLPASAGVISSCKALGVQIRLTVNSKWSLWFECGWFCRPVTNQAQFKSVGL